MSSPIHSYATLTTLLAEIPEAHRIGRYVHAYCKNPDCPRRFHSRPADHWNIGKKTPFGKQVKLRVWLRCDQCKSRLAHYRMADTPEC